MSLAKDEARKIIDSLPEQATWDDIMYRFYVKRKIEISLAAYDDGKIVAHDDVIKRVLPK
jgi:hypothetical protein